MSNLRPLCTRTILGIRRSAYPAISRRFYSERVIKENDIVLLKQIHNSASTPILSSRLRAGKKIELQRDSIAHDDILGKGMRDLVSSRKRINYRISEPTLAEYTDLSPRIVTPIYSQDANLIVSLLDLNPTVPNPKRATQDLLEIFEAGTGHGALTLNLARAIHGANTAAPTIPEEAETVDATPDLIERRKEIYQEWKTNRRAVIHTLDCSGRHSAHAETVVKNFRHGIYYPHIDFHVASIDEYLSSRLAETDSAPFLDHAILDLLDIHYYFDIVGKALKANGTLITFCPSITQINAGVTFVRQNGLPLFLEKVVEVGGAVGVGGREWDVRPVKPRALLKARVEDVKLSDGLEEDLAQGSEDSSPAASPSHTPASDDSGWEMVCRPKVGLRIAGGGFVGVWRKMTDSSK
ncbi:hypothetical protein N431DRAFT_398277, partial [Stipitochalara longipes BDJ]